MEVTCNTKRVWLAQMTREELVGYIKDDYAAECVLSASFSVLRTMWCELGLCRIKPILPEIAQVVPVHLPGHKGIVLLWNEIIASWRHRKR